MKTTLLTIVTLLATIGSIGQTVHIDSIPNPECVPFNLSEPGFAISPSSGRMYYGGKEHSFYSSNMGATWDTSAYNWTGGMEVNSVAISPINGNVYIGGGKFAMSTDSGASYTKIENFDCKDIYADPYGNVFAILGSGLSKYSNPNLTGGRVSVLLGGASLNNICIGEKGEMYAVGKKKIYMSTDTGNTWVLKREITTGWTEYRHVIAAANDKILYGEIRVNIHKTDTSFMTDVTVNGYPGANSIKTPNGFMFFPEKGDRWGFSFDNGNSFIKYYGSTFTTLVNGATVPRMTYEARVVNGLATYNNKIYYAGANCVITVFSKGAGTGIKENTKEDFISIYPNPISKEDNLIVKGINPKDNLVVRNIVGKEVFRAIGISKINLQSYKTGVYFLTVVSENKTQSFKFIVK